MQIKKKAKLEKQFQLLKQKEKLSRKQIRTNSSLEMKIKQKIAKAKRDAKKQNKAATLELGASAPPEIQQSKNSESRQARQRRKKRESAEAEENALTAGSACIPVEKLAGEIPDGVSFKESKSIFFAFPFAEISDDDMSCTLDSAASSHFLNATSSLNMTNKK